MRLSSVGRGVWLFLFILISTNFAKSADIKALSVGALRSSLAVIVVDFEKAFGHKVRVESGAAGVMFARIDKGENVDVAIVTAAQIDKLVSENKVIPGTRVKIAKIGMGLAAPKNAPKADIGSVDALKRTLLAAKSIGHTDPAGGASSAIYAAKLLASVDIATELRPKIKVFPTNGSLFEALSRGNIDFAFGQLTEILATSQVSFVGSLPDASKTIAFSQRGFRQRLTIPTPPKRSSRI
jgi:molybdate transport system substrate-binding protein